MQTYDRLKFRQPGFAQAVMNKFSGGATRLKKMLGDYPFYAPPHSEIAAGLSAVQARENQAHFEQEKATRLRLITGLLQEFEVELNIDEPDRHALMQLDSWAYQQWPAVFFPSLVRSGIYSFSGKGLEAKVRSMLFDTALILGECYLALSGESRWFLDTSKASAEEQRPSYNRMVILLPPKPGQEEGWHDVLDMEAQVFYHYSLQEKAPQLLAVDQKIGRVLAEPVLRLLS